MQDNQSTQLLITVSHKQVLHNAYSGQSFSDVLTCEHGLLYLEVLDDPESLCLWQDGVQALGLGEIKDPK